MTAPKFSDKPLKEAKALYIRAECPHCGASMTDVARLTLAGPPEISPDGPEDFFDNGHDEGAGAYVTTCESCTKDFAIPVALGQDVQHAALVLIGEA